ncbi:class I SAM-dependent methyltransferase [Rhodospirillales bacterium]|nr:class I SAM-dependent methyltransferase [Rhodospirillales bacterium]
MNPYSDQASLHSISLADLTKMSGLPMTTVSAVVQCDDLAGLRYLPLNEAETTEIEQRLKNILKDNTIERAGADAQHRWQLGWQEILERVRLGGISENTLLPQYFKHDILRLYGGYIRATTLDFEKRIFRLLKAILFFNYFFNISHVIEFGCGTGANLLQLHKMFPKMKLTGCDWVQPSLKLIRRINQETGSNIQPIHFNMFTLDGNENIDITNFTAVVTLHAMEQLGNNFGPFLDMLISNRPAVCIHLEPIIEFYDTNFEFDLHAVNYHSKRNYLSGLFNKLRDYEKVGDIEIIQSHRSGFGSTFQEAYSIIVWRPL